MAPRRTKAAEPIEITYRKVGNRYVFASADYKVLIAHHDEREAAARFVRLAEGLRRKGAVIPFRVEAYAPLGPALRAIRETGSIWQTAPRRQPQPLRRPPWQMPGSETLDPPPPLYASWEDYLARTSPAERLAWCAAKAKVANRTRLLSAAPKLKLTGREVLRVLEAAKGRALIAAPRLLRAVHQGRKGHQPHGCKSVVVSEAWTIRRGRYGGGDNDVANLGWSCPWCNTWPSEWRRHAPDHGGHYPEN